MNIHETANRYGVQYRGELVDSDYHSVPIVGTWTARQLQQAGGKIIRLRLVTDAGFPFYDISYCHGELPTGERVRVDIGSGQLLKARRMADGRWKGGPKAEIIALARANGYNAKAIGLLDDSKWSILF